MLFSWGGAQAEIIGAAAPSQRDKQASNWKHISSQNLRLCIYSSVFKFSANTSMQTHAMSRVAQWRAGWAYNQTVYGSKTRSTKLVNEVRRG